ncbi:hypothetical protein BJ508DRAFT_310099 [Ascobolus immersus RN42]|uniref:Carboxylic ester hydrolase n=1 Tax=Ascobolus immersus RN42 TaxID=1160509 RepID=A0A3N4HUF7_ASCIM|nr:hypothetical protein BJ508DRAFT_310099 [Ascobolus immersus RN42]
MKLLQSLFAIALSALFSAVVDAATFQQVSNYGENPGNVDMFYYIPDCLQGQTTGRPLVVALHYCHGTALSMFSGVHDGPSFKNLADKYGFVVVFPNVRTDPDGCWDVYSQASLTRYGGGESHSIANQVTYAHKTWGTAPDKVYTVGISGGAMMTNVLAAVYPDLFAGAAGYAGVAYGCFAGDRYWNDDCAKGRRVQTAAQWGDLVRYAYPGYTGRRPKVQIWHNTPDETLHYINMEEQVKQWTDVFGYSASNPQSVEYGSPTSAWTRRTYGPNFEALTSTIYTHIFPIQSQDTIEFFGLTSNVPSSCSGSAKPTTTSVAPSPTGTSNPGLVAEWFQCGGTGIFPHRGSAKETNLTNIFTAGYTGPTQCMEGLTCQSAGEYYSQCVRLP